MQIDKNSWSYALAMRGVGDWENRVPNNICPYMRKVALGFFKWALVWVAILAIGSLAVSIAVSPFLWLVNHYVYSFLPASWLVNGDKEVAVFMLFSIIGAFLYGVGFFLVLCFGSFELKDAVQRSNWYQSKLKNPTPPKPPGLIATYLKGLHDKTCVGLEFVGGDEADANS